MSTPTPRELAVKWFESVWQHRSKETVFELMAPNAVHHQQGGGVATGPTEFMAFHEQILAAFPHLSLQVLRAVGDDTQACIHWHVSHAVEAPGLTSSKDETPGFSGMSYLIVKDGKIIEAWDAWDRSAFTEAVLRR